jgi:hypothetical protein
MEMKFFGNIWKLIKMIAALLNGGWIFMKIKKK